MCKLDLQRSYKKNNTRNLPKKNKIEHILPQLGGQNGGEGDWGSNHVFALINGGGDENGGIEEHMRRWRSWMRRDGEWSWHIPKSS